MAEVRQEIVVARPLDVVREHVMEPEKVMAWLRNLVEYEFTTPGPPSEGSECRGVISVMGQRIDWRAKVVEWHEGGYTIRSLGLVLGPVFELSWSIEASGDGTLVTYRQSSPAFEGMTGVYIRNMVDKVARRDLERLRAQVESG